MRRNDSGGIMKYPKKHISIRVLGTIPDGMDESVPIHGLTGLASSSNGLGRRETISPRKRSPVNRLRTCLKKNGLVAWLSGSRSCRHSNTRGSPTTHTSTHPRGVTDTSLLPIYAIPPIPLLRSHSLGCCGNRWMSSAKHMVWMCGRSGSRN